MGRVAHFKGKYNQSKSKLFIVLAQEPLSWFSPLQLHNILGVPLETCRAQLRRLHNMRPPYIKRRRVDDSPGPWGTFHFQYQIGERGGRWYANALNAGMPVERYLSEIEDWQREHPV